MRVQPLPKLHQLDRLQRDIDRNSGARIPAVIEVVTVVDIVDVDVVGVVPVIPPGFRPWINGADPIAVILETGISAHNQEGKTLDSEAMVRSKVSAVPVVRDAVAPVAAPLLPGAVVGLPILRAMLLPCALLDTLLFRSALLLVVPLSLLLLLPVLVLPLLLLSLLLLLVLILPLLLLSMLLLLVLILPLLLLSLLLLLVLILPLLLLSLLLLLVLVLPLLLLSMLLLLVLVLPLLLLSMLLLLALILPLLLLSMLLLLVVRPLLLMLRFGLGLLVFALLLLGMILLFALLLLLCADRSSDSEKEGQNGGTGDSTYFHGYCLRCCCTYACVYCKLPVVALTGLPMASPDTRSSTLRFCWRPAELPLEATGKVLPKPLALTEFVATPCCTR